MSIPSTVRLGVLVALPLLPLWAAAGRAEAATHQPVAVVYSLADKASLSSPGVAPRPVRLFDRLPAGVTVHVGSGSRLELAFVNGLRYKLGEHSRVTLGPKDLASRTGPVRPLLRFPPLPRLSPIDAKDRPGARAGAVRIRAERITILYPCDGAATLAERTALRFEPAAGAGKYRIEVRDPQGNVAFATETTTAAVSLAAGTLKPGTRYQWTVRTVERAGPVASGSADFVTLSRQTAQTREALRTAVEEAGDSASLALLAEVDRSLGLLAEARDELRAAVQGSPGDALLAANLAELERRLPYRQSP